ncbi:MAG: hypothetical protein EON59_13810 [Alphaproteobacteria bacterium]|nr:MAG: hypothetical protein EON59_13810 [Alphaproteobacteria bacterium]
MSLFEFTFALSAVVLGLALTHIAATFQKLLLAGKQVRWSIESVLLACVVLFVIVSVWLFEWSDKDRTSVAMWQMLLTVAKLLTLYVAAASCLPEPEGSEPVNLREHYDRTRLLSFGALILSLVLFRIEALAVYGLPAPITFGAIVNWTLYPALYALLIFIRRRWFNITVLAFIIAYYGWRIIGIEFAG